MASKVMGLTSELRFPQILLSASSGETMRRIWQGREMLTWHRPPLSPRQIWWGFDFACRWGKGRKCLRFCLFLFVHIGVASYRTLGHFYFTYRRRMCLHIARGGQMHLPPLGATKGRCGLLPNYFGQLFNFSFILLMAWIAWWRLFSNPN